MRVFVIVFALLLCAPAWAADWTVQRVRGEVSQKIGMRWVAVSRGDVIDDNGSLQTGPDGRVGLVRGRETIALEGDTMIRIKDAGDARMTTVIQDSGTIMVDVERRNVQHFSVQTKYLAAVVKGTAFTVRAEARGASVNVTRGVVQVQDSGRDLVADIRPGQSASVTSTTPLDVTGSGPVSVFTFEGVQVVPGTTEPMDTEAGSKSNNGNSANNGVGTAVSAAAKAGNTPGSTVSSAAQSAAYSAKQSGSNVGQAVSSAVKDTAAGASAAGQSTAEAAREAAASASNGAGKALGLLK